MGGVCLSFSPSMYCPGRLLLAHDLSTAAEPKPHMDNHKEHEVPGIAEGLWQCSRRAWGLGSQG